MPSKAQPGDQLQQDAVLSAFRSQFGRPARLFRAPARVNIIGEHTDYNAGLVMPANANLHTWLAIALRTDRVVRIRTANFDEIVEVSLENLSPTPGGGWQEYPKAVFHVLQNEGFSLRGADILIVGEVPLNSGLSSSAALEVVTGFAMLSCLGEDVNRRRLAESCQQAENEFVGMSCGIMDQYVISLCERNRAMMLDCRSLEYELVPLLTKARLLIVNSGVSRRLRDSSYNSRHKECEMATARLAELLPAVRSLRDVSREQLDSCRRSLDETTYLRSRHVISENDRVRSALQAIHNDDQVTLGKIISASHASLKTDFEVSCDELDALVDIAMSCEGVYGSRMVGAGFGGCTVTVVDSVRVDQVTGEICSKFEQRFGFVPWYHLLDTCDPVHELPVQ